MNKNNDEKLDMTIDKKGLISANSLPTKPANPMLAKEQYIAIFKSEIKRQGATEMLDYLENKSDFFDAPASTRFHLAEKGGLTMHSLNVYYRLKMLVANEKSTIKNNISQESIAICALLHDICKANYYTVTYRNVKQIDGSWTKEPYYTVDEKFPFGHGEKSVFMINQFIKLSGDEALAINWHMGAYDERLARSFSKLGQAFEKCPLAVLTHIADMQATYLDEVE